MSVEREEPVAGGVTAAGARLHGRLRLALAALSGALALAALIFLACELTAARVPQYRAALEALIREQTDLELTFSTISVRWGWYGPEAVFHSVALGEPGTGGALLRAPRLIVGLDVFRSVRSGHLEAGRITLIDPDIDLRSPRRAPSATPAAAGGANDGTLSAGERMLSRWRGGRIVVEGGTIRSQLPDGSAISLAMRHVELRREAEEWRSEAELFLPESLGATVRLELSMSGDPARPENLNGTLKLDGRGFEFGGWRALAGRAQLASYLPEAGSGDLELRADFAHGRLAKAWGKLRTQALEWRAPSNADAALRLEGLRGSWQLAPLGADWHLTVDALELDEPATTPASAAIDIAADGSWARGSAHHTPLAALAPIARSYLPELPLAQAKLLGEARELTFDWSAHRASGSRLAASAELANLVLADPKREWVLSGLGGRLTGTDEGLTAELEGAGAELARSGDQSFTIDGLAIGARVGISADRGGWKLTTESLELRRADMQIAASGVISAEAPGAQPEIRAHLTLKDADVPLLATLLGPSRLEALGSAASGVTAGRIASAELSLQGPLNPHWSWPRASRGFSGSLQLRDATLGGTDQWPEVHDLAAHIEWRGAKVSAVIDHAQSTAFQLATGKADWDVRGEHPAHLSARLTGNLPEALDWLREHPSPAAPALENIDLRGDASLNISVLVPVARNDRAALARVRVAATLNGAELYPVAGLPPIKALRGTLAFTDGHLERSTLSGSWLGGPATLGVGERREQATNVLAISGRGVMSAREALLAAAGGSDAAPLEGSAEWSALLTVRPEQAGARWHIRADSNLAGIGSRLPEPFGKPADMQLPLHLEAQGGREFGELRVSLGERLAAIAALKRSGPLWRIERGALTLAGGAPALPDGPLVVLEGHVNRLDLPAYLMLWRDATRDAALPSLSAHLSAAQLVIGSRTYAGANVMAAAARGSGQLEVSSASLAGEVRWPALVDGAHPARLHVASFDVAQPTDALLVAGLNGVLGPTVQLSIDALTSQGRPLGAFDATITGDGGTSVAAEWHLGALSHDGRGRVSCERGACRGKFILATQDAAATLADFGLRPDVGASDAHLEGEFAWSEDAPVPLATLDGHLHMQLERGSARAVKAEPDAGNVPCALLAVPALIAGVGGDGAPPELHFSHLSADFELHGGQAFTSNLHFDGDAEILVRGRVGLVARDYDEQAWILRGEERLPAAVRRLGPTPKVAALWLGMREVWAGEPAEHSRAALRLRGTWDDPIVTPAEMR